MATRNHVQIAQDLVRFINIANDLIDGASYILQEIDMNTGIELLYLGGGAPRVYTFGELKADAQKALQAVLNYESRVKNFLNSYGVENTATAVQSLNLSDVELKADLNEIADEARSILSQLGITKTKGDLIPLGQHIDATIPKLDLVRRAWRYDI